MNTFEPGGLSICMRVHGAKERTDDFYKILSRITDEYTLEYVDTNHIILHDKGTGERIDLNGILNIFKWCVSYIADYIGEICVPLSKLHYLPMTLIRKAVHENIAKQSVLDGKNKSDEAAMPSMDAIERVGIEMDDIVSPKTRVDGNLVYFDDYEYCLDNRIHKELADLTNDHVADAALEEYYNMTSEHELAKLIKRG